MEITLDTDSFRNFPYPPDEHGNNGGFDLLKNPEKIEAITEFKIFPELRIFIEWLNFVSKKYRTFGCAAGLVDGKFTGYIEFSFRNPTEAQRLILYQNLLDAFEVSIEGEFSPEVVNAIRGSLKFEVAEIHYEGTYFGNKLSLFFLAYNQQEAGELLGIFFGFLKRQEEAEA